MARKSLGVLTIDLIAQTAGFTRGMDRAQRKAKTSSDEIWKSLERVRLATLAIGTVAVTSAAAWISSMSKTMDQAGKMADQIGTTTEALTGLRYAAEQMANVNEGTLDMSLRRMTRRISEAAAGGGAAKKALEELGVSAQELAKLPVEEQFLRIADAIKGADSQGQRLRATMAIFDTEGMPLVNALSQGRDEIIKYVEEAERFGIVISTDAAKAASDFQTNLSQLNAMMSGVGITIANEVLPRLTGFIEHAANSSKEVDGVRESTEELRNSSALGDFADGAILVLGYVADSANFLANVILTIGASLRAVIADAKVAMAAINKVQVWNWFSDDASQHFQNTLSERNETVRKSNEQLAKLLYGDFTTYSQAAKDSIEAMRFDRNFVGPMPQGPVVELPSIDVVADGSGGGSSSSGRSGSSGRALQQRDDAAARYIQHLNEQIALVGKVTEYEKALTNIQLGKYGELTEMQERDILIRSQVLDMMREQEEREKEMLEASKGYWEEYLEAAEKSLTSFDDLAANMLENFTGNFGNAFEKMVFDSESLGDSIGNLAEGMARSVVNALGQMAAQWLAYQVVQMAVGKSSAAASTAMAAATGTAIASAYAPAAAMASLASFGANSAPAMAGITATASLAQGLSLVGMAHDGIDSVPKTGTWLLEKGERVTTADTSARLDSVLDRIEKNGSTKGGGLTVNLIENPDRAGQVEERTNDNGDREADIFVADIMGDGRRARALESTYGLARVGR